MNTTQVALCIILAIGVLAIFFLAGTIIGGIHAYSKAFAEAEETYKNLDEAKEGLIKSLEGKAEAQKELIESYEELVKTLQEKNNKPLTGN